MGHFFVVTQPLPGQDVHKHWLSLVPGRIYEAHQVAPTYLVTHDPDKPGREIYVRLPNRWWWQRVQFAPETLDVAAFFRS